MLHGAPGCFLQLLDSGGRGSEGSGTWPQGVMLGFGVWDVRYVIGLLVLGGHRSTCEVVVGREKRLLCGEGVRLCRLLDTARV